jgi:hypothetical protein
MATYKEIVHPKKAPKPEPTEEQLLALMLKKAEKAIRREAWQQAKIAKKKLRSK